MGGLKLQGTRMEMAAPHGDEGSIPYMGTHTHTVLGTGPRCQLTAPNAFLISQICALLISVRRIKRL